MGQKGLKMHEKVNILIEGVWGHKSKKKAKKQAIFDSVFEGLRRQTKMNTIEEIQLREIE